MRKDTPQLLQRRVEALEKQVQHLMYNKDSLSTRCGGTRSDDRADVVSHQPRTLQRYRREPYTVTSERLTTATAMVTDTNGEWIKYDDILTAIEHLKGHAETNWQSIQDDNFSEIRLLVDYSRIILNQMGIEWKERTK